ncbi:MAG: (Fe-S)-binding protein [Acidimicrobiia bacterium]
MDGPTVQLVVTCLVDALAPEVGRATLAVLEDAGCIVEFPEGQTCCGQPAFNVGLHDDARTMAEHTLDVLTPTEGPIVLPSGSCSLMMSQHYLELFAGTEREDEARAVAARVRELTQFLVDDLGVEPDASCDGCVIAYHHSCHGLRGMGLKAQAGELLAGLDTVSLDGAEECCGFGGLFAVEMPPVSAAIMNEKLDRVEASGADILVGGDVSCLIHLEGGLRRRGSAIEVRHIAEILSGDRR